MKNNFTVKNLARLFLNNIAVILVITIVGGISAFCYAKLFTPVLYSSNITLYVQSYTANQAAIANPKHLVNTCVMILKNEAVIENLGELLVENNDISELSKSLKLNKDNTISNSSIKKSLSITSVSDASALKVVATTTNAELSAQLCDLLASIAPYYVEKAIGIGSLNTIETARVNNTPANSSVAKQYTLCGLAGSLLLALFVVIAKDYFDNTIKNSKDIEDIYGKTVIGEITRNKRKKNRSKSDLLEKESENCGNLTYEYDSIERSIMFSSAVRNCKIFVLSAVDSKTNHSVIAANIAAGLAGSDKKVLLIDANTQNSEQKTIFGVENKNSLLTLVTGKSEIEKTIIKDVQNNLDIILSGAEKNNCYNLICNEKFKSVIDELYDRYDFIIIDSVAYNRPDNKSILIQQYFENIICLCYGKTTFDQLEKTMTQIENYNLNVSGFIISDVKK